MKLKIALIIAVLLLIAFPCFAEWDFGINTYANIIYADNWSTSYTAGHFLYPGFNGVKVFAKYVHPMEICELESAVDVGFTGYGPGLSLYGGIGKKFYFNDFILYRISGDILVGFSSFAGGFNIGVQEMNEFQFMFNDNFGLGFQIGILYMNYIFSITHKNFLECPWGIEIVLR